MATYQKAFRLSTKGHCDVVDIDDEVRKIVRESGILSGIVNVSGTASAGR